MKKSISNFSKLSDGNLESKTHSIISSMTGNANFPTPVPALAVLQTAADAYTAALVKAGAGNRADVADKNAKRETLLNLLRSLCTYVNLTANGDAAMLLTSGFDISKDPQPSVITKPEIVRLENGVASGSLLVSVKAVKGAYSYLHEYTTDATLAPDSWVSTMSTSAKTTLSNLQPGTVYYCRVGAIGTNNQLLYSDAASRMVV
ncbi:fibronectin type III domain-containing protein [Lacibacter sp. H375]|uniref:fibronectin type III domain-containing protein n=1 Tax=Lacibacter sp. H375 TaxID=3133424 RepID=UPI0030C3548A